MESTENNSSDESQPGGDEPRPVDANPRLWKPLTRIQRRVAGVLVEKSKTTPDIYPMSLNGIKTGANQKSNRSPQMDLNEHEVEDVLYELRQLGAVVEVHSGGRVPKFKHQLYDWLGVDKAELAVMTELLLRGEQTLGELRARAARMEKSITGLPELMPIIKSLVEKQLVLELTPPGRGQMISHNLYLKEELDRLRKDVANLGHDESSRESHDAFSPAHSSSRTVDQDSLTDLRQRVEQLEKVVATLADELAELKE